MTKISPKVLNWLNEEQYRRWKKTGREPTQNELIREVIEIAPSGDTQNRPSVDS